MIRSVLSKNGPTFRGIRRWALALAGLIAIPWGGWVSEGMAADASAPVFHPPWPEEEIRRRVGGNEETGDAGTSRGLQRGLQRGLARGLQRGLQRGLARGLQRGLQRGLGRGLQRGLQRGLPRGLQRGLPRAVSLASPPPGTSVPNLLAPLAPRRTGLTDTARPTLYFYLSDPWPGPVLFTLNREDAVEPEVEIPLEGPFTAGFHAIPPERVGGPIVPEERYEWFVSLILDPVERSADVLGSGTLVYRPAVGPAMSGATTETVASTPERAANLAETGYWYGAMELLMAGGGPKEGESRAILTGLLRGEGLPAAAKAVGGR